MPSPVEALPWGSRSTTSVGSPTAASAVPRLMAVVVLPTPPFWFATTKTRGLAPLCSCSIAAMAKFPNLQNDTGRIGCTLVLADFHPPRFAGLGQFSRYRLTLMEQANRILGRERLCIAQKPVERRQRARGDDIERLALHRLDPL